MTTGQNANKQTFDDFRLADDRFTDFEPQRVIQSPQIVNGSNISGGRLESRLRAFFDLGTFSHSAIIGRNLRCRGN